MSLSHDASEPFILIHENICGYNLHNTMVNKPRVPNIKIQQMYIVKKIINSIDEVLRCI